MRERLDFARSLIIKASRLHGMHPEFFFLDGLRYVQKMKTNNYFLLEARESFEKAIFLYEKYLYLGGEKEDEVEEILNSLRKQPNLLHSSNIFNILQISKARKKIEGEEEK